MKSLFLVRHAKSSWKHSALPDRQRPLSDRGRRDAPGMGRRLHKRGVDLDLMVTSPAVRALATARILAAELGYPRRRIAVDERLYPGEARQLRSVIGELDDALEQVMLIGHNPSLSELAHHLASRITHLPTCAVAEFTLDADSWSRVGASRVRRVRLESPKQA